jgi:hypothetical protein
MIFYVTLLHRSSKIDMKGKEIFQALSKLKKDSAFLTRNRRYVILLIAILAAVVTPTADVFNIALRGAPLYLLLVIRIILVKLPAHRAGLPSKEISFILCPLTPLIPPRAGRGTFRSK